VFNTMPRAALQLKHQADRRRAILDAALELFVEHGYSHVSMRNVAARVGYSAGAIYSYFSSKEDLFYAVAEEGIRLLNENDPANDPSDDPIDDLRRTVRYVYGFSKTHPQFFALIFIDRQVPRISHDFDKMRFLGPIGAELDARVDRCTAAGLLPPTLEPRVAWRLLFAPMIGLASHAISERLDRSEDVDALVMQSIEVTLAGLGAGAFERGRDESEGVAKWRKR
jgi:AcrR family transcriptional regulator